MTTTTSFEDRFDQIAEKLVNMFDRWLTEFETRPVKTALKIAIILWLLKSAKRAWRSL